MRTSRRRILIRSLVLATVAAGATVVGATPAQAFPSGCTTSIQPDAGYSFCSGGRGRHQIAIQCQGPIAQIYWVGGYWAEPGHYSWAFCNRIWPIDATTGRYRVLLSNN
jgi:hypothetical protein